MGHLLSREAVVARRVRQRLLGERQAGFHRFRHGGRMEPGQHVQHMLGAVHAGFQHHLDRRQALTRHVLDTRASTWT